MRIIKFIIIPLVIVLIGLRLYLPFFLLDFIQKQFNKLPDYRVKIESVDVALIAGSYTIHNLQLWKIKNKVPVPFFSSPHINLAVQWSALFKGHFVGKITVDAAQINFVDDPAGVNQQLSIDKQWLAIVKTLFPLNINQVNVHNSQVHLRSFTGKPPFDIYLKNLEANITNMQNVTQTNNNLSSSFNVTANATGGGQFVAKGNFNPFAKQPTFKVESKLNVQDIRLLSAFLQHYTQVPAEQGQFTLVFEAAAADGKISGYAKPFIKNLKVGVRSKNPIQALYQGAVAVIAQILKNPQEKTIATKVNISGNIDSPDTSLWSVIGYLFRHAFIQALVPQIDHNVKMQDVYFPNKRK